jgi:DNA polymerase-1
VSKNKLLIIDSFALIFRAYYAFPPTLTNAKGEPVNAVFGFSTLLLDVILKFNPTHIVAVMDSAGPTVRQTEHSFYKSNRDSADDLMTVQIPRIAGVLDSLGIQLLRADGIEADDIIGTVTKNLSKSWADTIVVTGDQDLFQLIDEDTKIYLAARKFSDSKLFEREDVKDKLGIYPENVTDYKAIAGDSSDNIPGVRGIGPKGAVDLISKFGTLENIYAKIDEVDKKYKEKLIENIEIAQTSKHLATIHTDIPISYDINNAKFENPNLSQTREIFTELEFKSLLVKLDKLAKMYAPSNTVDLFSQESLMPENAVEYSKNLSELKDDKEIYLYKNGNTDYLVSGSTDTVYTGSINDLKEVVKGKKLISFNLKDHKELLKSAEAYVDLMISGVVVGGGRVTPTINSVLRFFNANSTENPGTIVLEMKSAYKDLLDKYEDNKVIKLENEILPVVIKMEENGICLDKKQLEKDLETLQKERESVQNKIFELAGHEINVNSPKQIGELLFVERQLSGARKTKTGAFSTDERTLRDLIDLDPIIPLILEFRELDKIIGTYLSPLPDYIYPLDGRVHATFDQIGAVSGRFASRNPNIQNIPKGEFYGVNIRNAFRAVDGYSLVSFDYSQQELRILAALAEEDTMLEYYNTGRDVHILTASQLFEVDEDKVTKEQRNVGKTVNFSIIYGISVFGLSDRLKISREVADTFIKKFYEAYPKIRIFMDQVLNDAKTTGYTETVLGRRRYNEMIKSNNRNLRAAAERELFNFIIQGSAADIMKMVLTKIDECCGDSIDNKLIAQIHDEYLFECKNTSDNIDLFVRKIYHIMKDVYDMGVEFKVEANIGERWGNLSKYDIKE